MYLSKSILFTAGFIIAVMFSFQNISFGQDLYVNEIMASNATTLADEDGDFEDWIELYNDGDFALNLAGYYLSDNPNNPEKWQLPEVIIQPQDFLVIFASGKDRTEESTLHTNFSISIQGEPILLSAPDGQLVDYFPDVVLATDQSFGRLPDGVDEWVIFSNSTPGVSNMQGTIFVPYHDELTFSHEQGLYTQPFELSITNFDTDAVIYYTLNGSDPDQNSYVYENAILIEHDPDRPNTISEIPTTEEVLNHSYPWHPPLENVFKATVIKAQAFVNGQDVSPIYCKTFFVHEDIYIKYNELPLISLVTDSNHLFNYETGIYVPGIASDEELAGTSWWGNGNYYFRGPYSERPAHFTLFENDGNVGLDLNIGIRMHGNSTRALPNKPLRLYTRNQYGPSHFNYPFFPWKSFDGYRRILLRQSGNDMAYNYIGDVLSSLFSADLNFLKQDFRPSVLFINGEFWGIMYIRDRIDKYYMEYSVGIDPDSDELDLVSGWWSTQFGSGVDFQEILEYVYEHDLSETANYKTVADQLNIENVIDYFIFKIYIGVFDWPGNNVKSWRDNSAENPSWHFLSFDNDHAFFDPGFDAVEHATYEFGTSWPNPEISTRLFRNLLKNNFFKEQFLNKFEHHLLHSFSAESMTIALDSIVSLIKPVMQEHINRWQYPASYDKWSHEIDIVREFIKDRPCYMLHHLKTHFEIENPLYGVGLCDTISTTMAYVMEHDIIVWPNPANHFLYIKIHTQDVAINVDVFDITGQLLNSGVPLFENSNFDVIAIDVSSLISGTYILKIRADENVYHKKFVKI